MIVARRLAACCLAALAVALVVAAVPASAAETSVTERIFVDYIDNGVLDEHWTASELSAAVAVAEEQGQGFGEFARAVQETYDRDILGLSTDRAAPAGASEPGGGSFLPQPRGPGERDQPPWPFLALSAMAAALVVTGAGTSIVRRARR